LFFLLTTYLQFIYFLATTNRLRRTFNSKFIEALFAIGYTAAVLPEFTPLMCQLYSQPEIYSKYFTHRWLITYVFAPANSIAMLLRERYELWVTFAPKQKEYASWEDFFTQFMKSVKEQTPEAKKNDSYQWDLPKCQSGFAPGKNRFAQAVFVLMVYRYFQAIHMYETSKDEIDRRYSNNYYLQTITIYHQYTLSKTDTSEKPELLREMANLAIRSPLQTILLLLPEFVQNFLKKNINYLPRKIPHASFGFWLNSVNLEELSLLTTSRVPVNNDQVKVTYEDIFMDLDTTICPKMFLQNPFLFKNLFSKNSSAWNQLGEFAKKYIIDKPSFCKTFSITDEHKKFLIDKWGTTKPTKAATVNQSEPQQEQQKDSVVDGLEVVDVAGTEHIDNAETQDEHASKPEEEEDTSEATTEPSKVAKPAQKTAVTNKSSLQSKKSASKSEGKFNHLQIDFKLLKISNIYTIFVFSRSR